MWSRFRVSVVDLVVGDAKRKEYSSSYSFILITLYI
jgi:hypothetical protein